MGVRHVAIDPHLTVRGARPPSGLISAHLGLRQYGRTLLPRSFIHSTVGEEGFLSPLLLAPTIPTTDPLSEGSVLYDPLTDGLDFTDTDPHQLFTFTSGARASERGKFMVCGGGAPVRSRGKSLG